MPCFSLATRWRKKLEPFWNFCQLWRLPGSHPSVQQPCQRTGWSCQLATRAPPHKLFSFSNYRNYVSLKSSKNSLLSQTIVKAFPKPFPVLHVGNWKRLKIQIISMWAHALNAYNVVLLKSSMSEIYCSIHCVWLWLLLVRWLTLF